MTLVGPTLASAAAPPLIKASSGPLAATLAISTHTPKINTLIPITVTATLAGKPAHATVIYQFVFGGAVVSTQYARGSKKPYAFTGHFADTLNFPRTSIGFPLTFRVVIKAGGRTVNLNCSIASHK